ncbi:hypothetical protein A3C25_04490 [Candidatus Roizmanbacteria bacterium RIFCSPHIGHO2_02_FULL_38_11]|uniref:Uncharacterized protein n=1 Tax=Candidatus Roizmanbacteria bacterium RIFCSPHIGHO2_02_FULL_38_11 TaxID=1802039 RepID=A0A1F7GZ86_9BACT|nr:MAG: hypothetical protein A3C25_04490 [Candidatus Roizmanbacteria bacterium RIFCSPHIGHO2_02_FULL_38_11]
MGAPREIRQSIGEESLYNHPDRIGGMKKIFYIGAPVRTSEAVTPFRNRADPQLGELKKH